MSLQGQQSEDEAAAASGRARPGYIETMPDPGSTPDQNPDAWQPHGDLALHARDAWIDLIAGPDPALRESLVEHAESMRAELAGPDPSPLEALLVGRIVACWLQSSYADAAVAQGREVSLKLADFARKRQDSAHKRYLSSIGSLAMVRRLLGSTVVTSGRGSKAPSLSAGPGDLAGSDLEVQGPGERETNQVKGEPAERGLVLEFGPPRDRAEGGQKAGGRRKPGVS
jgi:hypothetical protein